MILTDIPYINNRRSIRLKGYDYSQAGLYFLTICTHERMMLFGKIKNGIIMLNDAGNIAKHELVETPKHRPYVILHEHVVMPNHIHVIIEICRGVACNALPDDSHDNEQGVSRNAPTAEFTTSPGVSRNAPTGKTIASDISPKQGTLSTIVRAYKSAATKSIRHNGVTISTNIIWQRNYHEHIIRNEYSYLKILEYIQNNPVLWENDLYYTGE